MGSKNYLSVLTGILFLLFPVAVHAAPFSQSPDMAQYRSGEVYFRENQGQLTDVKGHAVPFVLYSAAAPGMTVYITEQGLTYVFTSKETAGTTADVSTVSLEWINLHLAGATIRPENIVKEQVAERASSFFHAHCPHGITNVREYGKLTVREVYPGIDWVIYNSSETGMKYDFVVHPGADPSNIRLLYESEKPLLLGTTGDIHLETRFGSLTERAPVTFSGDGRQLIRSSFSSKRLDDFTTEITYRVGAYPKDEVLTIDPQLHWGTRFGADGSENLVAVTHDQNGNVFITGDSFSPGFPVLSAGTYFQGSLSATTFDAVILKFNNEGVLLWSTYYGGGLLDSGRSIVCDPAGNVFVTGIAASADFPLQNTGSYFQAPLANGYSDIFLLKFDNAGNRLWATCYGGDFADQPNGISCDATGNIFIAGYTSSTDLPVQNAGTYFQPAGGGIDAFLLKFDNAGNRIWATYYGGSGLDIAHSVNCDIAGNVYATGYTLSANFPVQDAGGYFQGTSGGLEDVFLLKFDNAGNRLWSTYYGGNGDDQGLTAAASPDGDLFVTGTTASTDFQVQDAGTYFKSWLSGMNDAFVLKFDTGTNRSWATYYGGSNIETPFMTGPSLDNIAFDACGNVYISLITRSGDIWAVNPDPGGYCDGTYDIGMEPDIILLRFSTAGALDWATYVGDAEYNYLHAIEVNSENNLFVAGVCGNYLPVGTLLVDPGGGAYFDAVSHANQDGYILKFAMDDPVYTTAQTDAGCLCSGSASVSVSGAFTPYSYTWSNGSQTWGTTVPADTIAGLCPGTYSVEVTVCGHEPDTLYFTIAAGIPPVVTFTASDTLICAGTCIAFATPVLANAVYSWDFGDGTTGTQPNEEHCYTVPGTYDVSLSVTDAAGCTGADTLPAGITVQPSPQAVIHADPLITGINAPTVSFTSLSTGATSWHWSFGDPLGGESMLPSTDYTYTQPGHYLVQLAVANDFQCTDTATIRIQVHEEFTFFLPNAFTPGDGGVNETWQPAGAGIDPSVYKLSVFNRWGECVWSTSQWGDGWNGKQAAGGVYTWTADVKPVNGMPRTLSGHVTLLR